MVQVSVLSGCTHLAEFTRQRADISYRLKISGRHGIYLPELRITGNLSYACSFPHCLASFIKIPMAFTTHILHLNPPLPSSTITKASDKQSDLHDVAGQHKELTIALVCILHTHICTGIVHYLSLSATCMRPLNNFLYPPDLVFRTSQCNCLHPKMKELTPRLIQLRSSCTHSQPFYGRIGEINGFHPVEHPP